MVIKISFLILWIGLGLSFLKSQSVELSSATLTLPDGQVKTVNLPYVFQSSANGDYVFDIDFEAKRFATKKFIMWVDDCLEEITLNSSSLPHIGRRCLDPKGLIINFSQAYKVGKNHLTVKVRENGGKLKLIFKPYANNTFLVIIELIYILGIILIWLSISNKLPKKALTNCLLLAFVFRFLFIFFLHPIEDSLFADMAGHDRRARDIINGLQDATQIEKPPGYHYIVALSLILTDDYLAIKLIHLIAGILTCLIVAKASRHFFGKSGSMLILAIMAVHIPLIFIEGILMEECLFALCLAILFLFLVKNKSYFQTGIVFGLGFALKGTHIFFPPLAALYELIKGQKPVRKIIFSWSIFILAMFLVLGIQLGVTKKIYSTAKFPSAGAVNFIEGKCEGDSQTDINGSYRYSPLYLQIGRNRVRSWPFAFEQSDKVWLAGWECIKDNPYVLISSLSSIYYLFNGNFHWPFNQTSFHDLNQWYGMMFSFFIFPGILLGAIRLLRSPKKIMPFLPAFSLLICVWFFKSEVRFRVPFDTIFIPLSALGWASVVKAFFPKNHRKILFFTSISYVAIMTTCISLSFLDFLIQ